MTAKREPTLADRFIAGRGAEADRFLQRPYVENLVRQVRATHKFVFDEAAATRLAHVVRDIPELLIREHAFARAPFDLTWIEFPHWKYWREVGNDPNGQDDTADHTIGYLIDGNVATVIVGGTVGQPRLDPPLPGVFRYHLNEEWSENVIRAFALDGMTDTETLDRYMWGSTTKHLSEADRSKLRQRNRITLAPILRTPDADDRRTILNAAFRGSVGELRNIIAILLMLNRPTITRYTNMPAGRGWHHGKNTPYMAHTMVTIDLDAVPTMRLLGTPAGEGVPRRRHEVRGHYCHDHVSRDYHRIAGCLHDYRPAHMDADWTPWPDCPPNDAERWVCAQCGGKRWWRADHERGDAGRGYATHDYTVTG